MVKNAVKRGIKRIFDKNKNIGKSLENTGFFSIFKAFFFGGEGEIRTLEPFMAVTRFPVVRPRPTRRLLHNKYQVRFSPRLDSLPQKLPQVNSFMQFSEFIFIFLRGRGFFIRKDTRFLCVCCHFAQKQNCIFSMRNRWFRLWHIKVG